MNTDNISSFPSSIQAEQRFRRIQAEYMMGMTQVQIDRILSFELEGWVSQNREQLRQYLEQSMLYELMSVNYQIHFDTIRAIEYLSRLISDSIDNYIWWSFISLTREQVDSMILPESDKFFLNFVYSLYREDANFQEYLYVTMSDYYNQRAELIITPDASVTEDLSYLFIEIGGILELIATSITDVLEPYSIYPKNTNNVVPFRKIN